MVRSDIRAKCLPLRARGSFEFFVASVSGPQFPVRGRRIHQSFHESLLLVLGKLPDDAFLESFPGRLLKGRDHKVRDGSALDARGALNQVFLAGSDSSLETLVPLSRCRRCEGGLTFHSFDFTAIGRTMSTTRRINAS